MATKQVVTLVTSDNVEIKTNLGNVRRSIKIMSILEEKKEEERVNPKVNLDEVNSATLEKVLEWGSFHKQDGQESNIPNEQVNEWDKSFLDMDPGTLFEVVLAAEYLDIKELLDITASKVASMICGQTVEQIRQNFGIRNDFTKEEEEQIQRENQWCQME